MYDYFKPWSWIEQTSVVNMSWGSTKYRGSLNSLITSDTDKYNRLYVASAGNNHANELLYPAAYDSVLGVTGLWRNYNATGPSNRWYSYANVLDYSKTPPEYKDSGSNYRNDGYATYPISGIYDIVQFTDINIYRGEVWPAGRSTAPPWGGQSAGMYEHMNGTSNASPEVAALAALLYAAHPERQNWQVRQRIISTRDTSMEGTLQHPIAGLVNYEAALNGW